MLQVFKLSQVSFALHVMFIFGTPQAVKQEFVRVILFHYPHEPSVWLVDELFDENFSGLIIVLCAGLQHCKHCTALPQYSSRQFSPIFPEWLSLSVLIMSHVENEVEADA